MINTIGGLEDNLRLYRKSTEIHSVCENCNHSTHGNIRIIDKTNQTYGYIELVVNNRRDSKIECAADEKEFYEREIKKLKRNLNELEEKYRLYKELAECIESKIGLTKKWVECDKLQPKG